MQLREITGIRAAAARPQRTTRWTDAESELAQDPPKRQDPRAPWSPEAISIIDRLTDDDGVRRRQAVIEVPDRYVSSK
jgi:hypothetical protein